MGPAEGRLNTVCLYASLINPVSNTSTTWQQPLCSQVYCNVFDLSFFKCLFSDGVPPDGTPIKVINTIYIGVFGFATALFVIGMIFAIICLFFNILYRNKRYIITSSVVWNDLSLSSPLFFSPLFHFYLFLRIVKLTSPNLNYVILVGVVTLLTGLILYSIPTRNITAL